jgi:hypothetical protein
MQRGIGVSQATCIGMKIVRSENKLMWLQCCFVGGDSGDAGYSSNYSIIGHTISNKS